MRHGLASTYRNWGCRCAACREAATAAQRETQARMRAAREQGREIIHGSVSSYQNWGCRCAECREAKRQYIARWRSRT